jgi:hypothetical protein
MEENQQELIEKLIRDKLNGKSYSEIRKGLLEDGWGEEEVRELIRQVDEKVLEAAVKEGRPDRARQLNRAGLILAIAGLAVSIAFNAGLILQRLPAMVVYVPFFAGILLMFYTRITRVRGHGTRDRKPGPIRRKRPFK